MNTFFILVGWIITIFLGYCTWSIAVAPSLNITWVIIGCINTAFVGCLALEVTIEEIEEIFHR
jgi:hypothetical protein